MDFLESIAEVYKDGGKYLDHQNYCRYHIFLESSKYLENGCQYSPDLVIYVNHILRH